MSWSYYQQEIYNFGERGEGNLLIEAVAGSGKSTTLKELVRRLPNNKSCLVLAFNRHIRDPLERDLGDCYNVRVATLNSFGFSACRRALGTIRVNADKTADILRYVVLNGADSEEDRSIYYSSVKAVARLISLRKSLMLWELSLDRLIELLDYYDVSCPNSLTESELLFLVESTWTASNADKSVLDFDDQLSFPLLYSMPFEQFDFVLVDEAQDLSPVQIELCKAALRSDGRAIFCGDRKQAIYQFRGADARSIERIEQEMQCTLLPLSICYRCAKSIVAVAKQLVPQIEPAPDAPEGEVLDIYLDEFHPEQGDFVLCRTTAPLVEYCLAQIREGKKAIVKGRDIGQSLVAFVKLARCGSAASIEDFSEKLAQYYHKKREELSRQHRAVALQSLEDKYDTVLALAGHASTLTDLLSTIDRIFSDEVIGITFMTVHKAKGLEADTVYILCPELMPHPKASNLEAELNIKYVATTRAKRSLRIVHSFNRPRQEPPVEATNVILSHKESNEYA